MADREIINFTVSINQKAIDDSLFVKLIVLNALNINQLQKDTCIIKTQLESKIEVITDGV